MYIRKTIDLKDIEPNTGQVEGLPANPRFIKDDRFNRLVESIRTNPEMLELRELIVYPCNGKHVIIGGNMRYKALKQLKYKSAVCKILPADTPAELLRQYTIKDNGDFGSWDYDLLANEWDADFLQDCGVDIDVDLDGIDTDDEDDSSDDDNAPAITATITFQNKEHIADFERRYKAQIEDKYNCNVSLKK